MTRSLLHSWPRALLSATLAVASACAAPNDEPVDTTSSSELEASADLDIIEQALTLSGSIRSGQVFNVPADGAFRYFEVEGARCRNGSKAGVSVRRSTTGSKNVLFYLQGGGACFNTQTCLVNADKIEEGRRSQVGGIFDFKDGNPFKDYNVVYVPYCTGDFHMGNKQSSVDLGPSNQYFVGRKNIELILPSVVATFPGTSKVVISGSSAGGAGATATTAPVKRAFSAGQQTPKLYLIDDAGPWLSSGNNFFNDYLPVNEQTKWKNLWGLDSTIIPECDGLCGVPNFFPAFAKNVQRQLGRKPALMVGKQDTVVALQYANARVDQYPLFGLVGVEMRDALNDYRTRMAGTWSTYYVTTPDVDARQHTLLDGDNFYTLEQRTVSNGAPKKLVSWVDDYINDRAVLDVGP